MGSVREKSESANLPVLNVASYIHYATSFGPQVSHKLSQATAISCIICMGHTCRLAVQECQAHNKFRIS